MNTIKKIILLALVALIMVGCYRKNPDGSYNSSECFGMRTIVIDSCEYIDYHRQLAHKGSCKFCKERRQKELEELVAKIKEK